MNFKGRVVEFCPEERMYLIYFDVESEKLNIKNGAADVVLRYGDTKLNVHGLSMDSLDARTINNLKIKLLDTIYNYNKSNVTMLKDSGICNLL